MCNLRFCCVGYDFLFALCRATDTEYSTDVHAVDDGRRSTLTDERQRLTRHGHDAHRNAHVEQCLRNEQQGEPHGEECREVVLTLAGNASCAEQQNDVEHGYTGSTYDTHLLDDNGIDKVAERLRHEVALLGVARTFAGDIRRGDGNVGVRHLSILIEINILRCYILVCEELIDARLPRIEAVEHLLHNVLIFGFSSTLVLLTSFGFATCSVRV